MINILPSYWLAVLGIIVLINPIHAQQTAFHSSASPPGNHQTLETK